MRFSWHHCFWILGCFFLPRNWEFPQYPAWRPKWPVPRAPFPKSPTTTFRRGLSWKRMRRVRNSLVLPIPRYKYSMKIVHISSSLLPGGTLCSVWFFRLWFLSLGFGFGLFEITGSEGTGFEVSFSDLVRENQGKILSFCSMQTMAE